MKQKQKWYWRKNEYSYVEMKLLSELLELNKFTMALKNRQKYQSVKKQSSVQNLVTFYQLNFHSVVCKVS